MFIGTIRPRESRTVTVQGYELDELQDLIAQQTPDGWEIVSAPVAMTKRDTILTAEATIARRDGLREIQAEDIETLRAQLPEGYQLLSIREA